MWSIAKALRIPIDAKISELESIPYTISFVIRKRQQIDGFNELPKEKRPPEKMIWDGTSDDIDEWLERVFKIGEKSDGLNLVISDIEE